jgi:hypothetical protein
MAGTNLYADKNMMRPGRAALGPAGYNEPPATNVALQSSMGVAPWLTFGGVVAAPIQTANATTAPDGSQTGTRLTYPAVVGAGASSIVYQTMSLTAAIYTFSAYLKGSVGGEQVYLCASGGANATSPRLTLTTQWQRFSLAFASGPGINYSIGTDLGQGSQTSTSAQTIYAWGAQIEQGAFPTSAIPTTATPVTRQGYTVAPPGQGNVPMVAIATGLGNGGASVAANSDSASGIVSMFPGVGAAATGTLTLIWPVAAPVAAQGVFCAADWASLAVTQGNPLTIAWTAPAALAPNSKPHRLAYQWNNMN